MLFLQVADPSQFDDHDPLSWPYPYGQGLDLRDHRIWETGGAWRNLSWTVRSVPFCQQFRGSLEECLCRLGAPVQAGWREELESLSDFPHPFHADPLGTGAYSGLVSLPSPLGPLSTCWTSQVIGRPGMHTVMLDVDVPTSIFRGRRPGRTEILSKALTGPAWEFMGWEFDGDETVTPPEGRRAETVTSSTPRHRHLYVDQPVTTAELEELTDRLAETGLVQSGYARAVVVQGYAVLRLPWVRK